MAALVLFGAGWYYSNSLEDEALAVHHKPHTFDLRAGSLDGGRVVLETTSATDAKGPWARAGLYGLQWPGGYGQVATIRELDAHHVVRDFSLLEGSLSPGTAVRVDTFTFPGDPEHGLALPFTEVIVDGPLGGLPSWFLDAASDNWAILVHGQGADRREMLRPLRSIHAAGLKALIITYRNDEGAPAEHDNRYHFGETEWRDVDAAAAFALSHGAKNLVLVGHSMGGGIVMSFLSRSEHAAEVRAVVLDAPLLDLEETIRWRARGRAPGPIIDFGMWVSALRFGIDWDALDYVAASGSLRVPVLIFHGGDDNKVPLSTSRALAGRHPNLVTLVTWPGVGHVNSWNADTAAYERSLTAFLDAIPALQR
jgi:hypothetical protein